MAQLTRIDDGTFVLKLDDEPKSAPYASRALQIQNHLLASLPKSGGLMAAGAGALTRKAPNGERLPEYKKGQTAPPAPSPEVLKRLLDAIQKLSTTIAQLTQPATPSSDQARAGSRKPSAEARRLRAIQASLPEGSERFALRSFAAGCTPGEAKAALSINADAQWENPLTQKAFSGNKNFFIASFRHEQAARALAEQKAAFRRAK